MSNRVLCYGGVGFKSPTETAVENILLELDINKKATIHKDELQDMWTTVAYDANGVDLTPREDPQCLVITEQSRMVINGGYDTTTGIGLKNANIVYNSMQNKWFANSDYIEPNFSKRQIYHGSASYVPGKGAAFYGGYEEHVTMNWGLYKTNTTLFTLSNTTGFIGYPSFPWDRPASLSWAYDQFSAKHQSVYDPVTKMLLFMGGEYRFNDPVSHGAKLRPYNHIKAFCTETNLWSYVDLTGDMPEPGRIYSTLTLSVPINNNTIFVMWGIDSNNAGVQSILILDTTDPYGIKMSETYDNSSYDSTFQPLVFVQGISDGLKAGIAVAAVVVLALSALSIWFCIRNKKRNRRIKEQQREIAKRQQEFENCSRTDVEHMEVDWDIIENKCTEMPTADTKDDIGVVLGNGTSTTLVSRVETPSVTAVVINPDGIETHRPNTIDSSLKPPKVLKPDGGH
ncbi:hypothetical protein [Parasitella parasitica]|uniref:EF-hand domain-containing protein n=1 Tax=Parasitella parasitica TaxID=35722 RepID=A0A0B7N8D7_9FUNG|nr:hypothetical protein [Parasitella parasitica]